ASAVNRQCAQDASLPALQRRPLLRMLHSILQLLRPAFNEGYQTVVLQKIGSIPAQARGVRSEESMPACFRVERSLRASRSAALPRTRNMRAMNPSNANGTM